MPRFGSEEHGGRGEAGDGAQGSPHARGLSCQVLAGEPGGGLQEAPVTRVLHALPRGLLPTFRLRCWATEPPEGSPVLGRGGGEVRPCPQEPDRPH